MSTPTKGPADSGKVNLYDNAYGNYAAEVYRQVRLETYGEDFGQTSWVTTAESSEIPELLKVRPDSHVLELGFGSGGYALHLAKTVGCCLIGLDINVSGVHNANRLAAEMEMSDRARFEQRDISANLSFRDNSFDAAFSNDVLCHVPGRLKVLREMHRVLNAGGRILFSDALVIGGMVSHEEIATRTSIGYYVFSPPGENERLIHEAGFRLIGAVDTTENAATIARRWHGAREKRRAALVDLEGEDNFEGLQRFLSCVHTLTAERRLLRYLYVAERSS